MYVPPIVTSLEQATATLARLGAVFQPLLIAVAAGLFLMSVLPASTAKRRMALGVAGCALLLGELALVWFHWRLYNIAIIVDPATGRTIGHIAPPLWIESEKLYVWALIVTLMGLAVRGERDALLPGIGVVASLLIVGAIAWGKPFTEPLPSFIGQYSGYLQAMASNVPQAMQPAAIGLAQAATYYYNSWFMWIHPPLLFFSYGAFVISFVATLLAIRRKHSSYERIAYHWARLGYLPLTAGMLLGFPWALSAWSGEAWWWSGKVNMSIMMWFLYTGYLHGRLYLRERGMWRWVLALSVLSFVVLVLTYLTTYVIPGAHSYA